MTHPIILFDGICNFCNFWVNFLIKQDKRKIFKFAALQTEAAQKVCKKKNIDLNSVESIILIIGEKVFYKSEAVLKIAGYLGGIWKITFIFFALPLKIRDAIYDFAAQNRYNIVGKRNNCRIPSKNEMERFL